MKADGILRVTKALKKRLETALKAVNINGPVFVGPLDQPEASAAVLVLFLYRIVPNASLRNREHWLASTNVSQPEIFENALPLDLYFLITIGNAQNPQEQTPLYALGSAMQMIQAEPNLVGAEVGHETVRVTLEPLTTEEASRIWALFPTANYRTSVAYLATPVWIDPLAPARGAERVREDRLRTGSKVIEVVP